MFTNGGRTQQVPPSVWYVNVPAQNRFPELVGSIETPNVIIGGGLAGLMVAYNLAKRGVRSVVLEGGLVAGGDSSQLAGIGTRILDASFYKLEKMYGTGFVKRVATATTSAQKSLESLIRTENIECDYAPTESFFFSRECSGDWLQHEWQTLSRVDRQVSLLTGNEARAIDAKFKRSIRVRGESRLNPRKLCAGLVASAPFKSMVTVFENSFVTQVTIDENKVTVKTAKGQVTAGALVLASGRPLPSFPNLKTLLEEVTVFALHAQFADGAPCADYNFFDDCLPCHFYRRTSDTSIVFGGADQKVNGPGSTAEAVDQLVAFMHTDFQGEFQVTRSWHGKIYLTADGLPLIGKLQHNVYVCMGFGGTGFWASIKAGEILSALLLGETHPESDLFALTRKGLQSVGLRPRIALFVSSSSNSPVGAILVIAYCPDDEQTICTGSGRNQKLAHTESLNPVDHGRPVSHGGDRVFPAAAGRRVAP